MGIVQLQAEIAYRYGGGGGGGVAPVPCERTRGYTRAARWGKTPTEARALCPRVHSSSYEYPLWRAPYNMI